IFFLQVPAIGQQNLAQIKRRRRAIDLPAEALLDQARDVATVVQVGMGEHDRIERSRIKRKVFPVAQAQGLVALEQATVDEDVAGRRGQQILGTRYGSGGPQKLDLHNDSLSVKQPAPTQSMVCERA